jgi:hypothetical protein
MRDNLERRDSRVLHLSIRVTPALKGCLVPKMAKRGILRAVAAALQCDARLYIWGVSPASASKHIMLRSVSELTFG